MEKYVYIVYVIKCKVGNTYTERNGKPAIEDIVAVFDSKEKATNFISDGKEVGMELDYVKKEVK